MTRRRPLRVALVAVLVVLATGCGLAANEKPHVISADDVPKELREVSPSTSTTLAGSPSTTSIDVYYLVQDAGVTRLVAVTREVEDPNRPRDRLAALLVPPTAEEQARGILTSIPADTVLIDAELVAGTDELDVNLSQSLFDVQGEELRNAFAQLVWTATDLPGVRRVKFLVDGQEYRAPDAGGIEQPGPVERSDYAALAP